VLATAEVLRGRVVHFWPRAFADGVGTPIRSWRLVSVMPDVARPLTSTAEPLAAQWIRMPASDTPWRLRLEVTTQRAPDVTLIAEIEIFVRSPALVD
jgi:hypothetical protein